MRAWERSLRIAVFSNADMRPRKDVSVAPRHQQNYCSQFVFDLVKDILRSIYKALLFVARAAGKYRYSVACDTPRRSATSAAGISGLTSSVVATSRSSEQAVHAQQGCCRCPQLVRQPPRKIARLSVNLRPQPAASTAEDGERFPLRLDRLGALWIRQSLLSELPIAAMLQEAENAWCRSRS
jgi:hypothetical protein